MSERKTTIRAMVTCTVEIDVSDSWGGDCAMSQVYKQALESARTRIEMLRKTGGLAHDPSTRIVGQPKVTAIVVEEGP